jgi:hypothetical protein
MSYVAGMGGGQIFEGVRNLLEALHARIEDWRYKKTIAPSAYRFGGTTSSIKDHLLCTIV